MGRSATTKYQFEPDWAVVPGETLEETIAALGMDQRQLALRAEISEKHISQMINGHVPITQDTALKLERVTGVPAHVWNKLETNYRERMARIEDRKRLESGLDWLKTIPVRELISRGAISPQSDRPSLLQAVLGFFGVNSIDAWEKVWMQPKVAFRKSKCFESHPGATAAWLRVGELEAQKISCKPFSKPKFKAALTQIRKLTVKSPEEFQSRVEELCAEAGVAVVFVPEVKGCRASGVARWLTPDKAMIQLSLRHRTDDHLWFSFFHEAGHVLNDPKKEIYIDDGSNASDEREKQADLFACNLLIPPDRASELATLRTASAVVRFAQSIGIAPGIVVGRLQHDGHINYSYMNQLKQKFQWATEPKA